VAQTLGHGRSLDELLAGDEDQGSARGLKRSLCYGTLRWHFRLAEILRRLCDRPPDKLAPELRALLEVGLFQMLSGEVPPHAAVAETVAAARVLDFGRASGFVNAVLRRFQRERDAVLAAVDADLAARTAYPRWFVQALRRDRPQAFEAMLEAGLEIDGIGGCSIGAFISGMHASGLDPEEMRAQCREELVRRSPFNDYTLPRVSLIRSRKAARMLERVTEAAFGQRRKMLRQSLKGLPGALEALDRLGIDSQRRAETLSVSEFVTIAAMLSA